MLKKMSKKIGAKFPATIPSCSTVKIGSLDDSFLEVFLTASKPSRTSITAAIRREKGKIITKPKDVDHLVQNFDFCACPSENVVKRDPRGKRG